jgi:hypothetical protein
MRRALAMLLLAVAAGGCASGGGPVGTGGASDPAATLDALHDAASRADGAAYFALFEPGAVFLGTDASERWTVAEFRAYAEPYFSQGKGWTYAVIGGKRHIERSADGGVAWFDEALTNEKYGECRGTGVLRLGADGRWRIVQYNLVKPVPNELMEPLMELIRARDGGRSTSGSPVHRGLPGRPTIATQGGVR